MLIGSFVNLSAVEKHCRKRINSGREIEIICAGTRGEVTSEDVLFAGSVVDRLLDQSTVEDGNERAIPSIELNDQAQIAREFFRRATRWSNIRKDEGQHMDSDHPEFERKIEQALLQSNGGRNLVRIKRESDIAFAAKIDHYNFVPQWNPITKSIEIANVENTDGTDGKVLG